MLDRLTINSPAAFENLDVSLAAIEKLGGQRQRVSEFLQYRQLINNFNWRPGPHDDFHTWRVLAITAAGGRLVQKERPNLGLNQTALELTAAIHDSARTIDHAPDWGHGWRAAQWAKANLKDQIDAKTLSQVRFLCTFHALPDQLKVLPKSILRHTSLLLSLALFKDFDGVDRFRNGSDLRVDFLRLGVSRVMLPVAKRLHDATEARKDEGTPAMEIVATEAKRLGLMIE
ncbi:MAG: hypothetical protein U1C50_00535 [Patescibacteria group bacterium]|nr:hypothetical protein [Patescibacteria group bacterium]